MEVGACNGRVIKCCMDPISSLWRAGIAIEMVYPPQLPPWLGWSLKIEFFKNSFTCLSLLSYYAITHTLYICWYFWYFCILWFRLSRQYVFMRVHLLTYITYCGNKRYWNCPKTKFQLGFSKIYICVLCFYDMSTFCEIYGMYIWWKISS